MDETTVQSPVATATILSTPPDTSSVSSLGMPPNEQLEEYELGFAIGFGSTAIVHIGKHLGTNAPVAIKVFDLDRFEQSQIDRLRQELSVMALCKHENILSHLACLTKGNQLWLVMPLCSVGSIADVLKWTFPEGLEEQLVQCILQQVISGLCHLHSSGHCHRDLKAANLLLDGDGTVKLGDFGVSASLDPSGMLNNQPSRRKTFVGTPCWMAPEVMEGGTYDGFKADIWSVGIVALELAYGQAPYARYPPMKVIYLTLSAPTPPALDRDTCKHRYSRVFKEFIDYCLQRDPEKRPTADALLKHSFLKAAPKKPNVYLQEKLVNRCPPITARNLPNISSKTLEHQSTVEWDFSEDDSDCPKDKPGTISRRGRFTIQADDAAIADCTEQISELLSLASPLSQSNQSASNCMEPTAVRKGRFSVECKPDPSICPDLPIDSSLLPDYPLAMKTSKKIAIPVGQFEQLVLLVEMLRNHLEVIGGAQHDNAGDAGKEGTKLGHRRSSTSLGGSRRESFNRRMS